MKGGLNCCTLAILRAVQRSELLALGGLRLENLYFLPGPVMRRDIVSVPIVSPREIAPWPASAAILTGLEHPLRPGSCVVPQTCPR